MMFSKIKKDFPILKRKINGKRLIYLDNAATTQKPIQVIKAIEDFYKKHNANILRSIHTLGEEATEMFEDSRKKIAKFINAKKEEIIFVKNTTEAINLVAYSYGRKIKDGNIVTTIMEHHSNFVPWQYLCKTKNLEFRVVDINEEYFLNNDELNSKIDRNTKVVAFTNASNVLGTINDVKEICKTAHENNAIAVVDAAQSVPHLKIDVKDIDCDFLAFSAHKMLGPTGVGILYGKREILEEMEPFLMGGEMIKEVSINETKWNDLPHKFEAGTPNIADVIGFGKAIEYLEKIGMKKIRKHDKKLTKYALEKLNNDKIIIYGPKDVEKRVGLVSFNIKNVHSHDVADMLDKKFGIAVRSGHACAMPLMSRLKISSIVRASFYIYNDEKDIDALKKALEKIIKIFN
ncbi:MAG: cysteine desulfurase [Candidatus Aenigmarchaeota archaeon]|nr:cysteine desulfurase [Candidatus Aenigmarchaeota archaeon]MDW8149719.1 cysteine desulfurase [Candidatus Aenigmarchaeota archaeon]